VTPRVSFVVTCYNYGRYVEQAVDSLLKQTLTDLEVIVIDDCSQDNSAQVLSRYACDPRVRVVQHETNRGHIRSYNEGLALARGEYIGVLGADDYALRDDAVARQVEVFERHPSVGFVFSAFEYVDPTGDVRERAGPATSDYVNGGLDEFKRLVWTNYVHHSGTLVRRSCHDELGWYDERLPHAGDWDLWLRVATRYDVGYVADELYAYRLHDANMSHAHISPPQQVDECLLALERNFARLPASSPRELLALRRPALRNALFFPVWVDLGNGRVRRSWQGLLGALKRSPGIIADRAFYGALYRVLLVSAIGGRRFRRIYGGFGA
jgi:glycosyltransferase involved in cell wall biosynthesis